MKLAHEGEFTIYANPLPLLVSRQAAFPGLVTLPDGDILAMFSIGQAFDAADMRTHVSRSSDGGRTWSTQVALHDGTALESESFKPVVLPDQRLLAAGYVFERPDMVTPIADPETQALLPLRNKCCWSSDGGKTWTAPRAFSVDGAQLELSGPAIATQDVRILGAAAPFHLDDNGHEGWIIESLDGGESWHRLSVFFRSQQGNVAPWECRLCEMASGRIAVQFWAYDVSAQTNLDVHIALSTDGGHSFLPAIRTGIQAQASGLIALDETRILAIHAHREAPAGLVARVLRLSDSDVEIQAECPIFGGEAQASQNADGIVRQFGSLRFGQPGLLRLSDTDFIVSCWQVQDCQHVIRGDRLRLDTNG